MSDPRITPYGRNSATHELKPQTGVLWKRDDIRIRKFDEGVELGRIREALRDNNFDEVVFRTASGERYVIYADELKGNVNPGDGIEIDGIRGTVELVDNEWNESRMAAAGIAIAAIGGVLGGAALGAATFATGTGTIGDGLATGLGAMIGAPTGAAAGIAGGTMTSKLAGAFKETDVGIKTLSSEVRRK